MKDSQQCMTTKSDMMTTLATAGTTKTDPKEPSTTKRQEPPKPSDAFMQLIRCMRSTVSEKLEK